MRQEVPGIGAAAEDALVRDILADPFDEVPRLVYADWLEDQGKSLHAAILRAAPDERPALAKRLEALLREDARWPFTPALTSDGLVRVEISARSLHSKVFEEHGPAWLRRHHVAEVDPDVPAVPPGGTPPDWAALCAAGWLAHTRGLVFPDSQRPALPALAASPHLAALASLAFSRHLADNARFAAFFREAGLRGLCRLVRLGILMPLVVLQAIAEAPFAAHLRHLSTGIIHDEETTYLADAPGLAGLVTLSLDVPGDSGAKILAGATGLGSLRNLDLDRSRFGDVGLEALAGSPLLARLRRLRLTVGRHSTQALERLARAAPPQLRLVLGGKADAAVRAALAAILGERLILE